jgi:hypothetical protein
VTRESQWFIAAVVPTGWIAARAASSRLTVCAMPGEMTRMLMLSALAHRANILNSPCR